MLWRSGQFAVALALLAVAWARADEPAPLDWTSWSQMPVFDRGRRMPLDTFARSVVQKICGRTRPLLEPAGAGRDPEVRKLFPRGQPRRLEAPEVLFAWLAAPEPWESLPFLLAKHEQLRRDLLEVPLRNQRGRRLKYVSPRQVLGAPRFRQRLAELGQRQQQARAEGKRFELSGVDRRVSQLFEAYNLYRLLTYDPAAPVSPRARFSEKRDAAALAWSRLEPRLGQVGQRHGDREASLPVEEIDGTMRDLVNRTWDTEFAPEDVEPLLAALRVSADELTRQVESLRRLSFRDDSIGEEQQAAMNQLAAETADLTRLVKEMHMALYDNGRSLRLVPALNPWALRADRDVQDDSQPWLSFQALMYGSQDLLREYPGGELQAVRRAFQHARHVYLDHGGSDRPERFATAMRRFAGAVRGLGEKVEPLRRNLPMGGKSADQARMLAATAYPPRGYTHTELHYNRLDPFKWSWVVCLVSAVCLGLSAGTLRRPVFWLGILALIAAQFFIVYGFGLRSVITGWAPVTNMFETVVFTALVVGLLGTWFTLLPLIWPGIRTAWRLAALPSGVHYLVWGWWRGLLGRRPGLGPAASDAASVDDRPPVGHTSRLKAAVQWGLLLPQVCLMVWIFWALSLESYGSGGQRPIIRLLPVTDLGTSLPTVNDLLTWAVGLCVLVPTVWYGPRLALTAAVSIVTVPMRWLSGDRARGLEEAYQRRFFAVVGATVGFFASLLAYYAPIFDKDVEQLMPILRDNFWLTMHVLSITASYGAGALAWGLANVSLAYYLFGRYRDPQAGPQAAVPAGPRGAGPDAAGQSGPRRPPRACVTLAGFIYKATQVAVLLLAVGTITGALWADVAWGRFWGWDAKEVWALVSLLAYAIILHGRYAGWSGNFGLATGAVLGLSAIVMAWYGVNYVLRSGLHTYGGGSGGQLYVGIALVCNWLFVGAAAVRYGMETRVGVHAPPRFASGPEDLAQPAKPAHGP